MREGEERIPAIDIGHEWIGYQWFIARTRTMLTPPNQKPEDVLAIEALARLGIPSWYATGQRRGGMKPNKATNGKARCMVRYLMFPGYVFIARDGNARRFAEVLKVRHIDRFLSVGGTIGDVPMRVPGYAMQALFAGEDVRAKRADLESEPLENGESVQVISGAYAGFDAEVVSLITANRIEILLDFMGCQRPVEIPIDKIQRL